MLDTTINTRTRTQVGVKHSGCTCTEGRTDADSNDDEGGVVDCGGGAARRSGAEATKH